MEKFFTSLPKPMLAVLVIFAAVVFFMVNDPPHTVCDVQAENLKESLKGQIFPTVVNKNTLPPVLGRAQEACQQGNSAGSCFEYFSVLRKAAREIRGFSSECRSELAGIPEIRKALTEGVTLMAKMAWGSRPPEPGFARFGWLQDSELGLFCLMKDVYSQSFGEDAWNELRVKIYGEFPGESPPGTAGSAVGLAEAPKAVATMQDKDLWARSVFSVRCESYR